MAKITITIEDLPSGKVRVVSTPSGGEMSQMVANGHQATSAHGYALRALNVISLTSKEEDKKLKLFIPRLAK